MNQADWISIRKQLPRAGIAWPTFAVLLLDIGLLHISFVNSFSHWSSIPLVVLAQGVAFVQLYVVHHEAVHGSVFHRDVWNAFVGHLIGWLLIYPFLPRRQSHRNHHRWTGHPTGDPTNRRLIAKLRSMSERSALRLDKLWHLWIPFIALSERIALWREPFLQRRSENCSAAISREKRMAIAYIFGYLGCAYFLVATGLFVHFFCWYVPGWVALLVIEELINLPHHTETPLVDSSKPYEFWRQSEVTRSCQTAPLWSKWILLNFNLHTTHHLFPHLPWFQLPEAQRLILRIDPKIVSNSEHETAWSLTRRRKSFLSLYASYVEFARRE
jgi:acyl-lipid omega-6 desaturase (Delta-12 desaturase)